MKHERHKNVVCDKTTTKRASCAGKYICTFALFYRHKQNEQNIVFFAGQTGGRISLSAHRRCDHYGVHWPCCHQSHLPVQSKVHRHEGEILQKNDSFKKESTFHKCIVLGLSPQRWSLQVVDALLCTSAAPTYFREKILQDQRIFIDGGIHANCPAETGSLRIQTTRQKFTRAKGTAAIGLQILCIADQTQSKWLQKITSFFFFELSPKDRL